MVVGVRFVFPLHQSRLHPVDVRLVWNNARRVVASRRQVRLRNGHKIPDSLGCDIGQVDVRSLRICAILWTHRSLPPQFCAAAVPARNNINKNRPNCLPKVIRIRFIEIASGFGYIIFVIAVWKRKKAQFRLAKYWEIIAARLKKRGWSLGWVLSGATFFSFRLRNPTQTNETIH